MARDWERIRAMMREEYGYDDMTGEEREAFDRGLDAAIEKKKADEGEDGGDHHPASRRAGSGGDASPDARDDLRRETERDMAWDNGAQQEQEETEQEYERGRSR